MSILKLAKPIEHERGSSTSSFEVTGGCKGFCTFVQAQTIPWSVQALSNIPSSKHDNGVNRCFRPLTFTGQGSLQRCSPAICRQNSFYNHIYLNLEGVQLEDAITSIYSNSVSTARSGDKYETKDDRNVLVAYTEDTKTENWLHKLPKFPCQ